MRCMRRKDKESYVITKAVSYKASTNMRVVAIADKTVLTTCFYSSCRFEYAFKPVT
jgi:hypothetical protein